MRYLIPLLALLLFGACPKPKSTPNYDRSPIMEDPMLTLKEPPAQSKYQGSLLSQVPPNAQPEQDANKTKDIETNPIAPTADPAKKEVFGSLTAQLVPHPGRQVSLLLEKKGWQIVLTDLASPSKTPSPMMIARRASGQKEELGGIKVSTKCQGGYCVDGLLDGPKNKTLLAATPSQEELAMSREQGQVERVVRIASVGFGHVSVFLGRAAFDGKNAQLALECATFYRATGERISLYDLLPAKVADPMLREAKDAIQAAYPQHRIDPRSFLLMGPFPQELHFCALPPSPQDGSMIEIPR